MVLQAVVELAEEFVEQVAGSGGVAVAVFSPAPVVPAGGLVVGSRRKGPHPADVGEPVVLDVAVRDRDRSPRGPSNRGGSGVGLQRSGVAEPARSSPISASRPGAGRIRQPRKARNDRVVRMLLEQLR